MTQPDVETAIITALTNQTDFTPNVSTRLPADYADRPPWVTLWRAPGSTFVDDNTQRLEACRLELQARAATETDAFTAGAATIEAIRAFEGTQVGDIYVTSVTVPQTLSWLADPESSLPRYRAVLLIHARVV